MRITNHFSLAIKARHTIPIACIVFGVIFANSIYLSGKADPNPLLQRTDLAISSTPGKFDGRNTIDPNDGFTFQALGHLASKDWLSGSVPYWNHYEGVGAPLAGEMQSAAFLPLTLLLSLGSGVLYFHLALEIIAGVATYLLLIKLKMSRKIAVFGGLAFALNGTFAWLTNAAFNPIAFLPVLLLGIEMAYQATAERRKHGWLLIPIAIALSLYAGFPEVAYINGLLGIAWAAARFFQLKKPELRKNFARKLAVGGLTGILLAAPILIAFYDYVKYANIGIHAGSSTFGIVGIGLPNLFMPYIFGPIFGLFNYDSSGQLLLFWSRVGGYVTASLIFLAIFGLTGQKDRLLKRVLAGWVVVTVMGTYGLFRIMYALNLIPGIGKAAFYRYAASSFEMAIVILAAFGIAELTGGKITKKVRISAAIIMTALITAGVINAIPEMHRLVGSPHNRLWAVFSIVIAAGSVLLVFAAQLIRDKKIRSYTLISIVLLDILIMFMIPQLSTPRRQQIDTQPVSYLQRNIGQYRFFTLGPIQPNYGSYYKIPSININDVPIPASYSEYITKNINSNVNPLVFTGLNMKNPKGQTALQAFIRNFSSYEELSVKYLVAPKGIVNDSIVANTGMKKVSVNPAADIFELPNPKPYFEIIDGACKLQPDGKDRVTTDCATPSKLVRREQFMSGWSAKLDSGTVDITEYGDLFQSIKVPAGVSHITYYYSPSHILLAHIAMAVGITAVATLHLTYGMQKQKPAVKKPSSAQPKRLK